MRRDPALDAERADDGYGSRYRELTYQEAVRQFKKDWLTALLVRHGTVAATAHAAGMNRTDFYRVMQKLGIQSPNPPHRGNWGDL